ncbi:MAG: hypothetical protein HY814_09130 [Candidatus Riflebacteria bacterium]|nr:hypothetical protein [Candidatus Riflebacteria bacterium]
MGPGGAYVVPGNVPHGLQVLSTHLVLLDVFTPVRGDFRPGRASAAPRFTADQVRQFVRDWFALFDRNADVTEFLADPADQGLLVRFPEQTLWNHADFRRWYGGPAMPPPFEFPMLSKPSGILGIFHGR